MMEKTDGQQIEVSIKDLADILQVGVTTLKTWESFFEIEVERNGKNARRYTEDNINEFKKIKALASGNYPMAEIKHLLNKPTYFNRSQTTPVEIMSETASEENNFSLAIKPYETRINELSQMNLEFIKENKELIKENATLNERVKNNADIIAFKDNYIQDLKERISNYEQRKWWKFWN